MAVLIVFGGSIFAAVCNAASSILERRATGQIKPSTLFHAKVVTNVLNNKIWLVGIAFQITAFLAQALALTRGSLIIVQPLLSIDLIFVLLSLKFLLHIHIERKAWVAMIAIIIGLSGLLFFTNPRGGSIPIDKLNWVLTFFICGSIILIGAIVMRKVHSVKIRTSAAGIAAGVHYGLTAAVTKLVLQQLHLGLFHEITTWGLYALIVVGATSIITMQSMYGSGPLSISQPFAEIFQIIAGIFIGLFLFGDTINTQPMYMISSIVCLGLLMIGIILLGRMNEIPDFISADKT